MSLFGTAMTGLLAHQRALSTASHNIANAATPGYSRQRVLLETHSPNRLGGLFIGQGVQVTGIQRMQSELVNNQVRTAQAQNAYADLRATFSETIDSFLADESTGLAPTLESLFSSLQDVAADPTTLSARAVELSEAEGLVERLAQFNRMFEEQRTLVNGQISTSVDEINQYSKALADLNTRVAGYSSTGSAPNDLLDERDRLLSELSKKIDVTVSHQDDGSVSVFIGNGQSLVMGGNAQELVASPLDGDPESLQIGLKSRTGGAPADITRFMSGGELGGLLETRARTIDGPQRQVGLIALNLMTRMNQQNRLGLDLDGKQGQDIFRLPEVAVARGADNTASEAPGVRISNVSALKASDYRLSFDSSGYHMTRLPENETVALTENPAGSGIYEADGLTIDTSAMGTAPATPPASGDNWLIRPTQFVSGEVSVAITDPAKLAAAGAIVANPSKSNQGSAEVAAARAVDPDSLDLGRVVLSFDGTGYTATTEDGSTHTLTPKYDAATGTTTLGFNGWEVQLKGKPASGDTFVVESNAGKTGDNRNMLALSEIQNLRTLGGKSTIQGGYSLLLSDVGAQTRLAQITRDSSATLLESAQANREALSGVNLDEEAANLLKFQQAYEASAKVIAVVDEMFNTLLNAVG